MTIACDDYPPNDEDWYPAAPCPACGQVVLIRVDGTLNRHGNLKRGECLGA